MSAPAGSSKKTSPETRRLYLARAFYDMRRCLHEARVNNHPFAKFVVHAKNPTYPDAQPEQVMALAHAIEWCVQHHVRTWSASTWRLHRLGYRLLLDISLSNARINQTEYESLLLKLQSAKALSKSERIKKTSATRKKNLSYEDLQRIEQYLITHEQRVWSSALLVWLKSAIVTGLRPNEWQSASLDESLGKIILSCRNSKFDENRSYGPRRTIDLTGIPSEWIVPIRQHLAIVTDMKQNGMAEQHYQGCSALLLSVNKKVFPKRKANIQLYTGRHQFAANAKSDTSCSDKERAAMMGHKTTKTSIRSYGKGHHGSNGLTPSIGDPDVLQAIRHEPDNYPSNKPENSHNKKS